MEQLLKDYLIKVKDEVYAIQEGKTLSELIQNTTWKDLCIFVKDYGSIQTDNDGCIIGDDYCKYCQYDIIVLLYNGKNKKLPISGKDIESTSTTISTIIENISSHNNDLSPIIDLTIKAFATQPRQILPSNLIFDKSTNIKILRLHFLSINNDTTLWEQKQHLWDRLQHVEFRQSEIYDWNKALQCCNEQITISCTLNEFSNLSKYIEYCTAKELNLSLHFMLNNENFDNFCTNLSKNNTIEELSIQYLDISDNCWFQLMLSLQTHIKIKSLSLSYTDNFVDNYRRLDESRRTYRTKAVLDLIKHNINITSIIWPEFQHDINIIEQINILLNQRDNNGQPALKHTKTSTT